MKYFKIFSIYLVIASVFNCCERQNEDFSGIYCLNIQNMELTIVQTGNTVTFSLQSDMLEDGTGTISGDTLALTTAAEGTGTFTSLLIFSKDRKSFSGPFKIVDSTGNTMIEGIFLGNKGGCAEYDIAEKGIPKFVETDFTQLSKIEKISKFRSGFGHSFTDGTESCRSMKHYYDPYINLRQNNTVEIYSPVKGTIVTVLNDGHGESIGLKNKQIQIKPDDQPAFVCNLFHCDLASGLIATGKKVEAGELLGYARLYYEDLDQYATSFDIAMYVNTPEGIRLIPYFETMKDDVFNNYVSRGVVSRQEFTISKENRDADPLQCDGETFLNGGNIDNWVILN